jgi:GR25 family glycosyltransferase involved in LPS biosynthesis
MNISDIDAYCITIDRQRKDRAIMTQNNIKNIGFKSFQFYDGINGSMLTDEYLKQVLTTKAFSDIKSKVRYTHETLSGVNSVGCSLSHIGLWTLCVKLNKPIAIFEDDIGYINDDYAKIINDIYHEAVKNNYDLLRFFYLIRKSEKGKKFEKISDHLIRLENEFSTASYIITPKCAKIFLNNAIPIETHIDIYMNMILKINGLNNYGTNVPVFKTVGGSLINHQALTVHPDFEHLILKKMEHYSNIMENVNTTDIKIEIIFVILVLILLLIVYRKCIYQNASQRLQFLYFIIVLLATGKLFFLFFEQKSENFDTSVKKFIPKIIWTYWNDDTLPEIIDKCVNNWKHFNPDHKVVVVKQSNINKYVNKIPHFFYNLSPQRQADWIRLFLLKEHGGIWMDSSTMLTESFNWLHEKNVNEYGFYIHGFTSNEKYPVIENWFIASNKTNFIQKWFEEFDNVCKKYGNDGDAYLKELNVKNNPELLQKILYPSYLTMHVCAQKIMQIDGIKPYKVDIAEDGPLYLIVKANWNAMEFCKIITKKYEDAYLPKIIKMRGGERDALIEYLKNNKIDDNSICSKYLFKI